jgi:cell division protein ZapA (FtsZ GTPase activity inhibitor)
VAVTKFRLDVLGVSFLITADGETDYLEKILAEYREEIERIQKGAHIDDPLRTAIITGFSLCSDVHKLQNQVKLEDSEVEKLTLSLISRLDEALDKKTAFHE